MHIGNDKPFFLIAGPCQIESEEHAYKMASELTEITNNLDIQLITNQVLTRPTGLLYMANVERVLNVAWKYLTI